MKNIFFIKRAVDPATSAVQIIIFSTVQYFVLIIFMTNPWMNRDIFAGLYHTTQATLSIDECSKGEICFTCEMILLTITGCCGINYLRWVLNSITTDRCQNYFVQLPW